ncbi:MAG: hypothetical protein QMB00_05340 [Candidatus Nanopelagicales bacterium]|jgi:hypothetical protein
MKIAAIGIALLGGASLVLVGCSSDLSVGGTAECNDTTIAEAVTGDPTFAEYVVTDYKCADGWAFAAANPAEGQMGAPAMMIFEAEGQFWIPKSAADVCGTYGDGTYPSDAMVPESLYDPACLAG